MSERVCKHEQLNEDGICRKCGGDERGFSEPSLEPEAAPASEAQGAAAASQRALDDAAWMIISRERHLDTARSLVLANAELTQLRARVAILDAQEVELPDLDKTKRAWGVLVLTGMMDHLKQRERQLLDALRAVQAWRGVARKAWKALTKVHDLDKQLCGFDGETYEELLMPAVDAAIAAYDALAEKGER